MGSKVRSGRRMGLFSPGGLLEMLLAAGLNSAFL